MLLRNKVTTNTSPCLFISIRCFYSEEKRRAVDQMIVVEEFRLISTESQPYNKQAHAIVYYCKTTTTRRLSSQQKEVFESKLVFHQC